MGYVENLYGVTDQQLNNALIPSSRNMYSGNLIQPLMGGRTRGGKRGGNFASAIPALSLLAAQQLYKKSHKFHRSQKFRRSKRRRSRRIR